MKPSTSLFEKSLQDLSFYKENYELIQNNKDICNEIFIDAFIYSFGFPSNVVDPHNEQDREKVNNILEDILNKQEGDSRTFATNYTDVSTKICLNGFVMGQIGVSQSPIQDNISVMEILMKETSYGKDKDFAKVIDTVKEQAGLCFTAGMMMRKYFYKPSVLDPLAEESKEFINTLFSKTRRFLPGTKTNQVIDCYVEFFVDTFKLGMILIDSNNQKSDTLTTGVIKIQYKAPYTSFGPQTPMLNIEFDYSTQKLTGVNLSKKTKSELISFLCNKQNIDSFFNLPDINEGFHDNKEFLTISYNGKTKTIAQNIMRRKYEHPFRSSRYEIL